VCMHGVDLHTRVLGQCQSRGIDFITLNARHSDSSFAIHASHQQQARRRLVQYELNAQPEHALPIARRLVHLKLANGLRLLRRDADSLHIDMLGQLLQRVRRSPDADSLRGLEGSAQRILFAHWRRLLPESLGFEQRRRRPPPDPVNALLSLTYTLVYHEAIRQCLVFGLDSWLGFYHRLAHGRHSLACDLMEPLRPRIELWVVNLCREKLLDNRHFSNASGQCLLGKAGRELYYQQWYPMQQQWGRHLRRHAGVLARHLDSLPPQSPVEQAA